MRDIREIQIKAKCHAEYIFQRLDPRFEPNVFLVGLSSKDSRISDPQILVKADLLVETPSFKKLFTSPDLIGSDAASILSSDPLFKISILHEERVARAIKEAILAHISKSRTSVAFCSLPVWTNNFFLAAILLLDRETCNDYPVIKDSPNDKPWLRYSSFINAATEEFLSDCEVTLASTRSMIERSSVECIRIAGSMLTDSVLHRTFSGDFTRDPFECFNTVSALRYEGTEAKGTILLVKNQHAVVTDKITITNPIDLNNHRAVRKLLEVCSSGFCLLSDGTQIYGIGKLAGKEQTVELYKIVYVRHYTWDLVHGDNVLMRAEYGQPSLPRKRLLDSEFFAYVPRIFPGIDAHSLSSLWSLVQAATEQKHGTMLLVSSSAKQEAERLSGQSITVKELPIEAEVINAMTSVDGAVLVDPYGVCHAFGVILDGLATEKGSSARGARYNSAIRYIEARGERECFAVVVSEDGYIDLLPELMPQLPKGKILAKIWVIKNSEYYDEVQDAFEWLRKHLRYLTKDYVEAINIAKEDCKKRFKLDDQAESVWYNLGFDFTSNPEADDSWFKD